MSCKPRTTGLHTCHAPKNYGLLSLFESLGDKRPGSFEVTDGTVAYRGTGVSVCTGEFFDYIEGYRLVHKVGELDDVPVFQMILKERGIVGELFKGEYFDVGNQNGLMYVQHFLWEKTQEGRERIQAPFEMIVLGSGTAVPLEKAEISEIPPGGLSNLLSEKIGRR